LKWFLVSGRVKMIKEQTGLSEYKILKCCNKIREIMKRDIPKSFEGIVEVDETYFGRQKKDLQPLIENKVKKGTIVCSDTWRGYTGIATKGYLHRLVNHSEGEYVNKEGNHINGLVQRIPSGVDPTADPVDLIFLSK